MAFRGMSGAVLACLVTLAAGYGTFRSRIPNGMNVPDPCNKGSLWRGVGHWRISGGGDRNPFGLAFKAAGKTWTKALCQADSDGDGKTNGEELGDPSCTWTKDSASPRGYNLSHPGICEPPENPLCYGSNTVNVCNVAAPTTAAPTPEVRSTYRTAVRTTYRTLNRTKVPTLHPSKIPVARGTNNAALSLLLFIAALLAAVAF